MLKVLSQRTLNRTFLERQGLLRPRKLRALAALEQLVGLQAQAPFDPYLALFNRLIGFDPNELAQLLLERRAVRLSLMRSTIHLVSADDCLTLRPVMQSVNERNFLVGSPYGKKLKGIDLPRLLRAGRALLEQQPLTTSELAVQLVEKFPEFDGESMAYALRNYLPLIQVTPRGVWGKSGRSACTTARAWLDRELAEESAPDATLLRYLRAFGPASVLDVQTWSGLTRLAPVLERLTPKLELFQDEQGRTLYDVPGVPLVDAETPAPPRFMPEFDNALLSHADRSRIIPPEPGGQGFLYRAAFLLDGFVAGSWKLERTKRQARLLIAPYHAPTKRDRGALLKEAERVLTFYAPTAEHGIELQLPSKPVTKAVPRARRTRAPVRR
ncbi:MAG: winged helix DNA-binding domain-containing protein [Myxococcales bacterium]